MPDNIENELAFRTALRQADDGLSLSLDETHLSAMWRHFSLLVRQNAVMNLTRITDPVEAAVKHYADSLALAAWSVASNTAVRTLLDVGTGAGFPAVPLAIVHPDWQITAIDGTRKKIAFVGHLAADLGLKNLRTEHAHAKHWEAKDKFDVVTLRAVCKLAEAIDMCARFVSRPGWLIVYKTAQVEAQERDAGGAAAKAAGLSESCFEYKLEGGAEALHRTLHVYHGP